VRLTWAPWFEQASALDAGVVTKTLSPVLARAWQTRIHQCCPQSYTTAPSALNTILHTQAHHSEFALRVACCCVHRMQDSITPSHVHS
jgi:hypothetical protein